MRNTTGIGDVSTSMTIAALTQAGAVVSLPFGHSQRYDLVMEVAGRLFRVQCKTGRLEKGSIEFNACSRGLAGSRNYRGQIDYLAVYYPGDGTVYLVPVDDVGTDQGYLRIEPARNGQTKGIRWAHEYQLERIIRNLRQAPQ